MSISFLPFTPLAGEDTRCAICLGTQEGSFVAHPKAGTLHPFHRECIKRVLMNLGTTCPMCHQGPIDRNALLSLSEKLTLNLKKCAEKTINLTRIGGQIALKILRPTKDIALGSILSLTSVTIAYNIQIRSQDLIRNILEITPLIKNPADTAKAASQMVLVAATIGVLGTIAYIMKAIKGPGETTEDPAQLSNDLDWSP